MRPPIEFKADDRSTARFWPKVEITDGCWIWTASKREGGYGQFYSGSVRRRVLAHRYAYVLLVGPIPDGLGLDHLCRNPSCVNPAHLEPVTQRVNVHRGFSKQGKNARKTHCKHGHPFDEKNTSWQKGGGRKCRACHTAIQCRRDRERRAARRLERELEAQRRVSAEDLRVFLDRNRDEQRR